MVEQRNVPVGALGQPFPDIVGSFERGQVVGLGRRLISETAPGSDARIRGLADLSLRSGDMGSAVKFEGELARRRAIKEQMSVQRERILSEGKNEGGQTRTTSDLGKQAATRDKLSAVKVFTPESYSKFEKTKNGGDLRLRGNAIKDFSNIIHDTNTMYKTLFGDNPDSIDINKYLDLLKGVTEQYKKQGSKVAPESFGFIDTLAKEEPEKLKGFLPVIKSFFLGDSEPSSGSKKTDLKQKKSFVFERGKGLVPR